MEMDRQPVLPALSTPSSNLLFHLASCQLLCRQANHSTSKQPIPGLKFVYCRFFDPERISTLQALQRGLLMNGFRLLVRIRGACVDDV